MGRFEGKVAIITGASAGLGPVMARMMVAEGAKVVMAARRGDMVAAEAAGLGDSAIPLQTDVTCETDVIAMVDAAMDRWGQVDIMMNNAATPGVDKHIWEQTLENWNNTFAVDVTAAMLCSREVMKRSMMARNTGVILNFSSIAGYQAIPRKSHYCSAKASLRALTKVVAAEAAAYNVRCNCIVPGRIDTDLLRNFFRRRAGEEGITYEEKRAQVANSLPLKTFSTPEQVANLALFLVSDQSATMTGQSINVDSGEVMIG